MNVFELIDSSPIASFFIALVIGETIARSAWAFASIFTRRGDDE